ncbi:MAG: HlyD family efflux transporter periplasmic adaptor subunit [Rhodospirillaceae bacterium]|nr:HlyD family efflux transporter periplasmic adaptor subunit [Rhodospirillaceae bacterium]
MRRKWIYYAVTAVFLAYAAWMLGPYLRSTIVRDSSVTTWSRKTVAPIAGRIVSELPEAGSRIGPDGHVATIRNTLLLREDRAVEDTRDRALEAESQIAETKEYLADLKALETDRLAAKTRHAELFTAQLRTEIENLRDELAVNSDRMDVLQRIVNRQRDLIKRGATAKASLDEALLRVSEMEALRARLEAQLGLARLRQESAADGVYITANGETPDWLRYGELEIKLEERRARHQLHLVEADLDEAREDLEAELKTLAELAEAIATAPSGSLVFSVHAAPDATVQPGDEIVEWIDCSVLLVDVPVSDAELPLIKSGMPAEVVLEGEPKARAATVRMTRGSSAALGRTDLAAVAKGRTEGVAQALLTLDAEPTEFARCPVGRAAYVSFPGIGLIDVLRARLRL